MPSLTACAGSGAAGGVGAGQVGGQPRHAPEHHVLGRAGLVGDREGAVRPRRRVQGVGHADGARERAGRRGVAALVVQGRVDGLPRVDAADGVRVRQGSGRVGGVLHDLPVGVGQRRAGRRRALAAGREARVQVVSVGHVLAEDVAGAGGPWPGNRAGRQGLVVLQHEVPARPQVDRVAGQQGDVLGDAAGRAALLADVGPVGQRLPHEGRGNLGLEGHAKLGGQVHQVVKGDGHRVVQVAGQHVVLGLEVVRRPADDVEELLDVLVVGGVLGQLDVGYLAEVRRQQAVHPGALGVVKRHQARREAGPVPHALGQQVDAVVMVGPGDDILIGVRRARECRGVDEDVAVVLVDRVAVAVGQQPEVDDLALRLRPLQHDRGVVAGHGRERVDIKRREQRQPVVVLGRARVHLALEVEPAVIYRVSIC